MNAEDQLRDALAADAGVIAFVANRIYPDQSLQGAPFPMIVYERTSTEITATIHNSSPVASKVTVSASAWSKTRKEAEQIGDAMEVAMGTDYIGLPIDRFSSFDSDVQAYAAVIAFDVWEL